ncbi:MAG: hypothetical protein SOS50_13775, partial [Oliverpabstia sp.]|nr:hypothetical protein [Oliverpabstia sp.]
MTNQSTLDKLIEMRLTAMADAFRNQLDDPKLKDIFCKHFLEKNAKYFWRMLHLQIGESCKALTGSCSASHKPLQIIFSC